MEMTLDAARATEISATWQEARKLWLTCRTLFGTGMDADWENYFARRGGLTYDGEIKLASECLSFFRTKRTEVDASIAAQNKASEDAGIAQRQANQKEGDRRAWIEANLFPLFRCAEDLRETAAVIDLARGKGPISPGMPYTPFRALPTTPA